MSSPCLNRTGLSLIQVLIGVAVLGVLTPLVLRMFDKQQKFQATVMKRMDDEMTRKSLRLTLSELMKGNLRGTLLWSNEIADYLGVGSSLGITPIPAGARGSILTSPGRELGDGSGSQVSDASFQVFAFIQKRPHIASLNLTSEASFSGIEKALDGTKVLNISGETSQFAVGSVVGIESPIGIQMLVLDEVSPTTITVRVKYTSLPAPYLPPGTLVHPIRTVVLGRHQNTEELVLHEVSPGSGAYTRKAAFTLPGLEKIAAQKLSDPLDPSSWVTLPKSVLQPESSSTLLRVAWEPVPDTSALSVDQAF